MTRAEAAVVKASVREYREANPLTSQREIAIKLGVSAATVSRALRATEIPQAAKPRARTCPDCGTSLVAGARFCHICGRKADPTKDEVLHGLDKVLGTISTLYPAGSRDRAVEFLNNAIDFIEKHTKED